MIAAPTTKEKENLYAKPGVGKCYGCGEPKHRSNECPKGRLVNKEDYEDEDKILIETEPEDSDFIEEDGKVDTCVVPWLLCNKKTLTLHIGIRCST